MALSPAGYRDRPDAGWLSLARHTVRAASFRWSSNRPLATAIGSDASCERRQSFAGDTRRGALDRNSERSCKVEDGKITISLNWPRPESSSYGKAGMGTLWAAGANASTGLVCAIKRGPRAMFRRGWQIRHRRVHVVRNERRALAGGPNWIMALDARASNVD